MISKQNTTIDFSGVGNVDVYSGKSIFIDARGVGNVTYKGNPGVKNIICHNVGSVKAI